VPAAAHDRPTTSVVGPAQPGKVGPFLGEEAKMRTGQHELRRRCPGDRAREIRPNDFDGT
jgi:hypothetical protein